MLVKPMRTFDGMQLDSDRDRCLGVRYIRNVKLNGLRCGWRGHKDGMFEDGLVSQMLGSAAVGWLRYGELVQMGIRNRSVTVRESRQRSPSLMPLLQ